MAVDMGIAVPSHATPGSTTPPITCVSSHPSQRQRNQHSMPNQIESSNPLQISGHTAGLAGAERQLAPWPYVCSSPVIYWAVPSHELP